MKGMILIPAYQAGAHLSDVLKGVLAVFPHPQQVVVIDDGSTDWTADAARRAGVRVLSHKTNRGKGAALKTGFAEALRQRCDFVVLLDADGQHAPEAIPAFIRAFVEKGVDLVIGTRKISPQTMPFDRYLSNQYSSLVASVAAGRRLRDSQSGYRLIRCGLLDKLHLHTDRYETETELLIQAIRFLGASVAEVPVRVRYADEPSHIRRVGDTWRFIKVVLKTIGMI